MGLVLTGLPVLNALPGRAGVGLGAAGVLGMAGLLVAAAGAPPERCLAAARRLPIATAEALRKLARCLGRGLSVASVTPCTGTWKGCGTRPCRTA